MIKQDVVIIIPARIGSTRLANKPLELIGSKTMIEHVVQQAQYVTNNIYVATDSHLIAEKAQTQGATAILTKESTPSGTDRVYEALNMIPNIEKINYVINLQGDMPFIDPKILLTIIEQLKSSDYEIITPVTKVNAQTASSNSAVKVVVDKNHKALYFSRSTIPHFATEFLYHIGVYGFRKHSLEKFVNLPSSYLEIAEKLEQLRAIENNIDIGVCYVDTVPISVDTETDLKLAREFFSQL